MILADLDVLVVDCQTTGATPHHGDVLEIGWTAVRAEGPREPVYAHRVALPEGREIPRVVSRLTGLVRESLEGALTPAEAHELMKSGTKLVDVRTKPELQYVGKVPGALEVEWQTYPGSTPNPEFIGELARQAIGAQQKAVKCSDRVAGHIGLEGGFYADRSGDDTGLGRSSQ